MIELEGQQARGLAYETRSEQIVIGRDAAAHFAIPLTSVSRFHAVINWDEAVYVLEDKGSRHGTSVNGRLLESGERKALRDGDRIEIGGVTINVAIDVSEVQMIMITSDQDLTLEANDGSTPDFTIELEANKPFIEVLDGYHTSELTDDVTTFYATNSSGAAANLRILGTVDATPA